MPLRAVGGDRQTSHSQIGLDLANDAQTSINSFATPGPLGLRLCFSLSFLRFRISSASVPGPSKSNNRSHTSSAMI
eukprot:3089849-Rhodomonas_salina.1